MLHLKVQGTITQDGTLEVKLPKGIEPGEVDVTINRHLAQDKVEESQPFDLMALYKQYDPELRIAKDNAEVVEMIKSGEIDTSGWEQENITDPVAWVEEMRQKEWDARWNRTRDEA